eukprot:389833_1
MSLFPATRVALWTPPRCCGTAFTRCISQLSGVKIFNEPYLEPFYFGEKRVSHGMENDGMSLDTTSVLKAYGTSKSLEQITYELIDDYDDCYAVFFRNHAYHVIHHNKFVPKGLLNIYTNTFMIRHPENQIKSAYRTKTNPEVFGERSEFDPNSVGWKELFEMFSLVTNELKQEVIVVDAYDMMKEPEDILKQYCELTGLKYHKNILNWSDEIDGVWNYADAIHGQLKQSKTFWSNSIEYDVEYPRIVYECIEEAMPYYQELSKCKLIAQKPYGGSKRGC